jgi:hypothetical protein
MKRKDHQDPISDQGSHSKKPKEDRASTLPQAALPDISALNEIFCQIKSLDSPIFLTNPQFLLIKDQLVWKIIYFAYQKNTDTQLSYFVLDRLLEVKDFSAHIPWNFIPDSKHEGYGISIAWLALQLALYRKHDGLSDILLGLPANILAHINYSGPLNPKNPFFGKSIEWMAQRLAERGKPQFFMHLLSANPRILDGINWNAPQLQKGEIIWVTAWLASDGKTASLSKILEQPRSIFSNINWNATISTTTFFLYQANLAWLASFLADRDSTLLNILLESSNEILARINWDSHPQNPQYKDHGLSVVWLAAKLAYLGKPALLNRLLELPNQTFVNTNWNYCPTNSQHPHYGTSIATMAVSLAISLFNRNSSPLNKLLAIPHALETVRWEPMIHDIFSIMSDEKTDMKHISVEKLINDTLILKFPWNEKLKNQFCKMLDRRCLEWDMAFADLSLHILQKLKPLFNHTAYKKLSEYLEFLMSLKSDSPRHWADSNDFCKNQAFRASTAYLMMARAQIAETSFSKRIMLYEKISDAHPFYSEAQFELANLYMCPDIKEETEKARKKRLRTAFTAACKWIHYSKKINSGETTAEKQVFLKCIVTEMLSLSFDFSKTFLNEIRSKALEFTTQLETCEEAFVPLSIALFVEKVKVIEKDIEIMEMKEPGKVKQRVLKSSRSSFSLLPAPSAPTSLNRNENPSKEIADLSL